MTNKQTIVPLSLKDTPALIEKLLPVQKLSAEAYKEQMAGAGKTLTALGSYWKGRKPLILNKACVLGCLLPVTDDLKRDLEIFEKLMAMDDESFVIRLGRRPKIGKILASVPIQNIHDYFEVNPANAVPRSTPFELTDYSNVKIKWRDDLPETMRRRLEAQVIVKRSYREMVAEASRPEEVIDKLIPSVVRDKYHLRLLDLAVMSMPPILTPWRAYSPGAHSTLSVVRRRAVRNWPKINNNWRARYKPRLIRWESRPMATAGVRRYSCTA